MTYFTERDRRNLRKTESSAPGDIFEVQFKKGSDVDKFIEENRSQLKDHVFSVAFDSVVYFEAFNKDDSESIEESIKELKGRVLSKYEGYNLDSRALMRSRERV